MKPLVSLWQLVVLVSLFLFSCISAADQSPMAISGARTIDVFEAKQLYDQGAVFIDVRGDDEWKIGHIDGAIHLDFQRDFSKLYGANGITRQTPLVIYCNSSNCLRSAYASAVSVYWGFRQVYYFRSGYFSWMLEDFPVTMQQVAYGS
ncbi:MAG: sulfurtransferase [Cellvibrionaceae bacterium]|nr:sulfurtransferase [Cellvibrionaceae bacterium]|tara:strand:- start:32512 stop:32955 length:444 start_codon:yes stop_codon:yes gene_type:complete